MSERERDSEFIEVDNDITAPGARKQTNRTVTDRLNCSDMYHVVYTQYLFTVVINKVQMCSSQFNLTRMFLNSLVACFLGLMILFHLLVNCLRVNTGDRDVSTSGVHSENVSPDTSSSTLLNEHLMTRAES